MTSFNSTPWRSPTSSRGSCLSNSSPSAALCCFLFSANLVNFAHCQWVVFILFLFIFTFMIILSFFFLIIRLITPLLLLLLLLVLRFLFLFLFLVLVLFLLLRFSIFRRYLLQIRQRLGKYNIDMISSSNLQLSINQSKLKNPHSHILE